MTLYDSKVVRCQTPAAEDLVRIPREAKFIVSYRNEVGM